MIQREFYDKSTWGEGEWLREPDQVFWISDVGSPCMITRNLWGAWTGAVGVSPSHPLYMCEFPNTQYDRFTCHGGVVAAYFNVTADAEFYPPGRLWWIGFACMTPEDAIPNKTVNGESPPLYQRKSPTDDAPPLYQRTRKKKMIYRNMEFATVHALKLAHELFEIDVAVV